MNRSVKKLLLSLLMIGCYFQSVVQSQPVFKPTYTAEAFAAELVDWSLVEIGPAEVRSKRSCYNQLFKELNEIYADLARKIQILNWDLIFGNQPPEGFISAIQPNTVTRSITLHLTDSAKMRANEKAYINLTMRIACVLHELQNSLRVNELISISTQMNNLSEQEFVRRQLRIEAQSGRRSVSTIESLLANSIRCFDVDGISSLIDQENKVRSISIDQLIDMAMNSGHAIHYQSFYKKFKKSKLEEQ